MKELKELLRACFGGVALVCYSCLALLKLGLALLAVGSSLLAFFMHRVNQIFFLFFFFFLLSLGRLRLQTAIIGTLEWG
jgi:hypothetical protein